MNKKLIFLDSQFKDFEIKGYPPEKNEIYIYTIYQNHIICHNK